MTGRYRIFLLAPILLLSGCISAPRTTEHPKQPQISTTDGSLRYALPPGWIDASSELHPGNEVIWLLREDYDASMTVGILVVHDNTASALGRERLQRAAHISLQLGIENDSTRILEYPREVIVSGQRRMMYRFRSAAGDNVRVILIEAGSQVFEVTMLVKREAGDASGHEADQDRLVESLRW